MGVAKIRTVHSIRESNPELRHSTKSARALLLRPKRIIIPNYSIYLSNSCEWPPQGLGTFELFWLRSDILMWISYWTYPYNPIIATMGKKIGRFYKYYRSKISNPTLKKPVLSSSANHTSYTTNSTPTIMSYQLQHKDSNSI